MKRLFLLTGLLSCFHSILWAQIESVSASGVLRKDPRNPTVNLLFRPNQSEGYYIASSKGHAPASAKCPVIGRLFETQWDDVRVTVVAGERAHAFTSEIQGCTTDGQDMFFMLTGAEFNPIPNAVLDQPVTMMLQENEK